jgi:geranylgeranyl pyrophosphate synthase
VIESTGGRASTEALARDHLAVALDALRGAPLEPSALAELVELAEFVCDRQR